MNIPILSQQEVFIIHLCHPVHTDPITQICRSILPLSAEDQGGARPLLPAEPGLGGERDRRRHHDEAAHAADPAAQAARGSHVGGRHHLDLLPAGEGEEQLPAPPDQALGQDIGRDARHYYLEEAIDAVRGRVNFE